PSLPEPGGMLGHSSSHLPSEITPYLYLLTMNNHIDLIISATTPLHITSPGNQRWDSDKNRRTTLDAGSIPLLETKKMIIAVEGGESGRETMPYRRGNGWRRMRRGAAAAELFERFLDAGPTMLLPLYHVTLS